MTFSFDNERYINERLDAIWLYDTALNTYTNLLNSDYTFTPNSLNEDNRFYITIEFKTNIPTNIENTNTEYKDFIFDVLGRRISNTYKNGIYIIFEKGKYNKVIR